MTDLPDAETVEAILSIHHAPDGLQCMCGLDMSRRRESGELGFLWKFDHEKHRAHVAAVIAKETGQ